MLYVGGQEGRQFQQLAGAVPRVQVQVEVGQPAQVRKSFSRSGTQTVPGQVQSLETHEAPEAETMTSDRETLEHLEVRINKDLVLTSDVHINIVIDIPIAYNRTNILCVN